MLVCHCHSVQDRQIKGVICHGARSLEAIGKVCGAGTSCQGCVPAILELLEEARPSALREITPSPEGVHLPIAV